MLKISFYEISQQMILPIVVWVKSGSKSYNKEECIWYMEKCIIQILARGISIA